MTDVFLNSIYVGTVKNRDDFIEKVVTERRMNRLPGMLNIENDDVRDRVYIELDHGRVVRPLIVVREGKSTLTDKHVEQLERNEISFSDLVKQGVVEYLDAAEEENALVAFADEDITPEHTHLELAPFAVLGLNAAMVPFGHHCHGVRLSQGSKNQKQAVGYYAANYQVRMDMDVNLLHYPQLPLVSTMMYDVSEYEKHPHGQNLIVAVMTYKGYNMEDAIVINKSSVDRGLGRSTYFRPLAAEELRYSGGLVDEIGVPDKEVKGYRSERDYRNLETDGIIFPEAKIGEADVIIGKTSPPRFLSSADEYNLTTSSSRESSIALQHGESGVVDFVMLTENSEGNKLVQVRLREQRIPEIGDKFISRHAQKGVISLLVPDADMPFTASGIKPDLLFGPHGMPSRMTISHLMELLGGKVAALSGRIVDATSFQSEKEDDLRKELLKLGFREDGTETMYNGITGDQYTTKIYIGNMFYMRLKHMVRNRVHSRATGPIQLLTRQPTEGRAKEGGLRLGEMEKDTFVAHGASALLKERFDADRTTIAVCEDSGLMSFMDSRKNEFHRFGASETSPVSPVEMSYAFKLLLDEIRSLGLNPRLKLERKC
ncbi:MAG: DNA-directed RNA polymerase subunit B [Candidatus Woesearchaeota archaeon]|nr:MAG: DNA-directed RNA polymerase subunit B [Candidatus Woesearchaeota archaeon]